MATWPQITIEATEEVVQALRRHWRWQLGDAWTPLVFSAIGDVFFEVPARTVWWLSTATGALEQIADSIEHFQELLHGDSVDEWFLPGLVDVLRAQGKVLAHGQCYTYAVFPIFAQGSFSAENMHVAPAGEHFAISGRLHERIRTLADGAPVQLVIAESSGSPVDPGADIT